MSLTAKLVALMKRVDRKVWPDHRVAIGPEIAGILDRNNLVVADVGSADGPQEIWLSLARFIHFLTFEPNPRAAQPGSDLRTTNFPIGLWSERCKKELFLTRHPDSTSLMPKNVPLLEDFLCKEGTEVVGSTTIKVDTLDHVLSAQPNLKPDFLKVDVEGGDLEVLKGGVETLNQSILGLRVETSFVEQHIGAPLLGDIDAFLRRQGFILFHLARTHWIRTNNLHGFSSAPQVIWGDAVYFLTRESFIKRLSSCGEAEREPLLAKFIVILVRHGVHDYSWEIIEKAHQLGLASDQFAEALRRLVRRSLDTSPWYFIKGFLGIGFAFLVLFFSLPLAGPRKRGFFYVKQRVGRFCYDLWRFTALEGRSVNSCVGDHFV